jgi:hypothetical protein
MDISSVTQASSSRCHCTTTLAPITISGMPAIVGLDRVLPSSTPSQLTCIDSKVTKQKCRRRRDVRSLGKCTSRTCVQMQQQVLEHLRADLHFSFLLVQLYHLPWYKTQRPTNASAQLVPQAGWTDTQTGVKQDASTTTMLR